MSSNNDALLKLLQDIAIALPKELLRKIQNKEATAADLGVARNLLRDNGIVSYPGANEGLDDLADKLGDVQLDDPYTFPGAQSG